MYDFCYIGCRGPIFHKIGNARGWIIQKLLVLGEYHSWIISLKTWIILVKCRLPLIYTLWLILNLLPQSSILRPLGIRVFSLCIQTSSLLSLSEFALGKSFGNLIYSSICMVMLGSRWSLWLSMCLATVLLWLCLMSNMWPWNLSMILFFVCPTYFVWHQLHSRQYIKLLLWQVPLVIVL